MPPFSLTQPPTECGHGHQRTTFPLIHYIQMSWRSVHYWEKGFMGLAVVPFWITPNCLFILPVVKQFSYASALCPTMNFSQLVCSSWKGSRPINHKPSPDMHIQILLQFGGLLSPSPPPRVWLLSAGAQYGVRVLILLPDVLLIFVISSISNSK